MIERDPSPHLPGTFRPWGRVWFWYDHPRLKDRFFNGPHRDETAAIAWLEHARRQGWVKGAVDEERISPDSNGQFSPLYYVIEPKPEDRPVKKGPAGLHVVGGRSRR